ncbi:MAG TPA: hypothetical protein VGH74_14455, partial [Planctomycetaceae bacterium]
MRIAARAFCSIAWIFITTLGFVADVALAQRPVAAGDLPGRVRLSTRSPLANLEQDSAQSTERRRNSKSVKKRKIVQTGSESTAEPSPADQQPYDPSNSLPDSDQPAEDVDPLQDLLQQAATPIDLPNALQLAGVQNPLILLGQQRVVEACALRQLAAAQFLPTINL